MNENIDLTKILDGCPKGTKLHSKLSTTYMLLDCKRQSRTHSAHYIQECITHQNTLLYIVSEYGEEVQPANLTIEPDNCLAVNCLIVRILQQKTRQSDSFSEILVFTENQ